jgi:DNA-binding GntR family transcriptional regulator
VPAFDDAPPTRRGGVHAQARPVGLAAVEGRQQEMPTHHLRGDLPAAVAAEQDTQLAAAAATGNPVLEREQRILDARMRRFRHLAGLCAERWAEPIAEQAAIMTALRARDPEILAHRLDRYAPAPPEPPGSTPRSRGGSTPAGA